VDTSFKIDVFWDVTWCSLTYVSMFQGKLQPSSTLVTETATASEISDRIGQFERTVVTLAFTVTVLSLVTGLLLLVLLLNQRWTPPLRLQVSDCNTFPIMCDVPSIAVFCSESIESFPVMAYRFFRKTFVTIPVAPVITGIILQFKFHIRCIHT